LRDATRAQLESRTPGRSAFLTETRRCDPVERLQKAWFPWFPLARAILRCERCASR